MKLFALPLLAILSVAAFAATPFTQGSNQFCTYHLYSFASRYTCTLIPSTNPTSGGYDQFYIDMSPDGTFTGEFDLVPFTGTFTGPQNAPICIAGSGAWGTINAVFGLHQIGGYKGSKVTVQYLVGGSGGWN